MAGTLFFGNLRFWKNVRVPFSKFTRNNWVLKMPPFVRFQFLKIPQQKWCFKKSRSGNNSQTSNLHFQRSINLFHIYGKMDLEKLITTRFEIFSRKLLTCSKPCRSKTLCFDLNPKGAQSWISDAAGAAAGRILKSRSRPLPTHPGMKYFCEGNPRS